ncbi:SMI1/KNR4 family protein [Kitasatospora aureofaciens]|uniref:SMI1/KNR4 family protein n=1 Tax=Kitasatospora aureofaciens TaxID=1894 RepID=UPI0005246DBF|nr:SMI1/KNR4 family protein [Kitasatospora aureofaciens]
MRDYLAEVFSMLGPGGDRFASPEAWTDLEAELGTELPEDYKAVVDAYAPMQINGHLYLKHPATERLAPRLSANWRTSPDRAVRSAEGPDDGLRLNVSSIV